MNSPSSTSSFQILQQACSVGQPLICAAKISDGNQCNQPQTTTQHQILIATTEDLFKLNSPQQPKQQLIPTAVMMVAPMTTAAPVVNVKPGGSGPEPEKQKQIAIETDEDYLLELSTLEGAAHQSRLSPDKMCAEEMLAFSDVVENTSLMPIFLHIRNSILKFWLTSPKYQLLFENVCQRLEQPFNNDPVLISRIFYFLERHGYINFGVFQITKPLVFPKPKKVAIIGAGIAGLIAARQLQYFGFDVLLLEARNRLGGRIWTYDSKLADVGSFVITGLNGNPMRIIARQINLEMCRINQKCPLYLSNSVVDKSKDEILENVFNSILESTSTMVKEKNINSVDDQPLSLGDGLDIILELHERQVRLDYLKHLKDLFICEEALSKNLDALKKLQNTIQELYEKHREASQSKTARNPKQEYAFRVNRYDLNRALELHKSTQFKIESLQDKIQELESESKNMATEYLSPIDRRILDWHFANLEFATGTSLKNLSLQHWDLDDEYQFSGPQVFAKDGHNQVVFSLAGTKDLDIRLNQVVQSITLTPNGAEVTTINVERLPAEMMSYAKKLMTTTHSVDAVLCTLPLGVLKNSINTAQRTEYNDLNRVQFKPPLPQYKCQAIDRIGFGNLNKVVLIFEHVFWDLNTDLFGNVSPSTDNRGELFLFTSVSKQPILVAFIAGEAADNLEKMNDETIKTKCLTILTNMYGQVAPLKDYFVTRWKSDPWSQGSYSFVAKGATGDDFDLLAEPISYSDASNNNPDVRPDGKSVPRLFFAGEHTIRQYPSTVHGALLSGLREAAKIANQFLGVPYSQKN